MKWWQRIPKKMTAAVVVGLVQLLPLSADVKHELVKLAAVYILGQGAADWGKEAKKAEIAADLGPS